MRYQIKDIGLASTGHVKIEWAKRHMPVLNSIEKQFKETQCLKEYKIAMCLHLEAKTACLGLALKNAGAKISMCGSNPLSTQDDVTAALVDSGVPVFAWRGESEDEYRKHLSQALEIKPHIIIDDGGDLITMIHRDKTQLLEDIIGGCEETTTGIHRLRAMEKDNSLKFPVIAVNNGKIKYLFDNRYGTGQSTMDSIMRTTNLVMAGKNVVVSGYGWCGRGIAMRAKGLGARVIITEVDPIRANEALMDGYSVMPIIDASQEGDIFITTTGCKDVITKECFNVMGDGALLANAGHFDIEISKTDLDELSTSKKTVRENIEEYLLKDGRRLYLLGEGRLTNLAAGDGHPVEIMDLSFALQALGVQYISKNKKTLEPKVIDVPDEIDMEIARLRLDAIGIKIDELTDEQKKYLKSW